MATDIPVNANGTFDEPTWGEGGTYSESAYEGTGTPLGVLVGPNDFNHPRRQAMRWLRALRDRIFPADAGLFGSCMIKSGAWNTGGGTLDGTVGASWMVIDGSDDGGVVVQFLLSAGSPHTFSASRDTYVALNEDGLVEYNSVPLNDPAPIPSSKYVNVWKIVTDGTELTSATVLISTIPLFKAIETGALTAASLAVDGASTLTGNTTVGGTLGVTGAVTLAGALTANGTATLNGSTLVDDDLEVSGESTLTGLVSCGADLEVAGGATVTGFLTANGSCSLGDAGSDTHTITGTLTLAGDVNFGSNTITGAGGTVTTSTVNASSVNPTVVNFNTTTQSTTNGRTVYDGRRLSVGDGAAARRVHHPKTAYVVSDSTTSATDDITGASFSMEIDDDEWVYFRVSAIQQVGTSGQDPKILIAATNGVDSVSILNTGDGDQAQLILPTVVANNDRSPTGFTVRWKPTNDVVTPDNTLWTIRVRHGVGGGVTITTSNVFFEGWYE